MNKKLLVSPLTNHIYLVDAGNLDSIGEGVLAESKFDVTDNAVRSVFEWMKGNLGEDTDAFALRYKNEPYVLEMRRLSDNESNDTESEDSTPDCQPPLIESYPEVESDALVEHIVRITLMRDGFYGNLDVAIQGVHSDLFDISFHRVCQSEITNNNCNCVYWSNDQEWSVELRDKDGQILPLYLSCDEIDCLIVGVQVVSTRPLTAEESWRFEDD